jgi:hypothetical protein
MYGEKRGNISRHGQLGLMVLPLSHICYCGANMEPKCPMPWMSAVIYSKFSR